jgi:hypothetical protein
MIMQLSGGDADERVEAASWLLEKADVSALPHLLHTLTHCEPAVRHTALVLIRDLHRRANERRDLDLRVALEADNVISAISSCLYDENPLNVLAANIALNCIANPAAKSALKIWRGQRDGTGPLE